MLNLISRSLYLVILAFLFIPTFVHAEWPPDGLAVCTEALVQKQSKIVSDGAGGAIIVWTHNYPNGKIHAQRVDGSGHPYWTAGGIQVSGAGDHRMIDMVSDGANGAIIVYFYSGDAYAQRIDGTGTPLWAVNGILVLGTNDEESIVVAPDGLGGVVVAAEASAEIYAQRLDIDGNVIWNPAGVKVSFQAANVTYDPCIVADGTGGALIAYLSTQSGPTDNLYVNRVFSSGSIWSSAGTWLFSPSALSNPVINGDGYGGALVAWQHDYGSGEPDIVASKVNASGTLQWIAGICTELSDQINPDILSDGLGGAYIAWADYRSGGEGIYAQRIDALGNCLWTDQGVPICDESDGHFNPKLLDFGGGFIVGWIDERGSHHLAGQKVDISGLSLWLEDGERILDGIMDFGDYDFATDGGGGLFVTCMDDRGSTGEDIYAQALNTFGDVASPEPAIVNVEDVPGDQGGTLRITIGRSERDDNAQTLEQVMRYDVWQRVDDPVATSSTGFLESEKGRFLETASLAVTPAGTWEIIGSFDATQSDEYIYRVSTLADSTELGIPYCHYVVTAHTTNPAVWYVSDADSGYSVDNLVPAPPLALAGEQSQSPDGLQLTWDPNTENDLWYYAVYRGTSETFIPGTGNLIATPTDEEWFDGGWDWEEDYWYKVSAVDENGNESDFAITGPDDITGGDPPPIALANFLDQNHPNPFNPVTTITFGIKEPSHVSLCIFDASGRLVLVLVNEVRDANRYHEIWDGRDTDGADVASGVYFYSLTAGSFMESRKMILLR